MASSLGRASIVIGSAALGHRASLALAPLVASSSHLSAAPVGRIVGVFTSTKDASDLASGGVGGVSEQRTDDGGPRGNARDVGRMPIHALSELPAVVKRLGVRTALLTDAANAQAHAQLALDAGCTHVVNMTLATVHPLQGARMWHEPLISRLLNGSSGEPSFISAALLLSTGRFAREFSVVATLGRGGYGTAAFGSLSDRGRSHQFHSRMFIAASGSLSDRGQGGNGTGKHCHTRHCPVSHPAMPSVTSNTAL
ncbi:hypothetical protein T492DRAFT_1140023 [Pavlovales sp. CCMP2436]|nr:hypothetical protein T492DRAFT_1140023 [Pavlovales sp. CCMP2436]